MKVLTMMLAVLGAAMLTACGNEPQSPGGADGPETTPTLNNGALLDAILAGDHRSEEERARDVFRHPKQTLLYFELEPGMTVIEAWPGGGWYTQIIAPYLKSGGGKFYAAGFAAAGASEQVSQSLDAYRTAYVNNADQYGDVTMSILGQDHNAAPAGSADVALTFRNMHNWLESGAAEAHFEALYRALKPGGVLGIVDHRADGAEAPRDGSTGYVYEQDVIDLASAAGFDFEGRSDINANPRDTKDHPFGVWTLPPVRRSSAVLGMEEPGFDRTRYDAIGESDRMTLKFRKPLAADGALFE